MRASEAPPAFLPALAFPWKTAAIEVSRDHLGTR
jgi:hypothetical protein